MNVAPLSYEVLKHWCDRHRVKIAELNATRLYDGRSVSLRENRGGWKWWGISGTCMRISADTRYMVIKVSHDPDGYWPVGMEIIAELDDETVAVFHPLTNAIPPDK